MNLGCLFELKTFLAKVWKSFRRLACLFDGRVNVGLNLPATISSRNEISVV